MANKTHGGIGTNQYQIKGRSVDHDTAAAGRSRAHGLDDTTPASLPAGWTARDAQDCFDAYLTCAAWSSTITGEDGEDLPADSIDAEFSDNAKQALRKDLDDFVSGNAALLEMAAAQHGYEPSQAGHDFWLTRNRHGAGFWDRGLGVIGDELTKAAHVYGSADLYLGDSGQLEAQ